MMRRHSDDRCRGKRLRTRGFTLIELMITLAVVAILAAIAYPLYEHQIEESRRTDARTALLELASREQRYFATNNAYTQSTSALGYTAANWPVVIGSGYYEIAVTSVDNAANPPSFLLTATAIGTQTNDTSCATFSVNSVGLQAAQDSSGGDSTATCW